MGRCARAAPWLLLHVNLLLMLYAGAMLSTAARLKWDPSLYVAARELFPQEYRAAAAALPALAAALLLLAQLPPGAARCRRARRALLLLHGAGQLAAAGAWLALGGAAWARGAGARAAGLRRALALREHALPLLRQLASYHPLAARLDALVQEAEADLPRNLHVLLAAAALLAVLQLLAGALALVAALAPPRDAPAPRSWPQRGAAPLRTAYRRGRLVPL